MAERICLRRREKGESRLRCWFVSQLCFWRPTPIVIRTGLCCVLWGVYLIGPSTGSGQTTSPVTNPAATPVGPASNAGSTSNPAQSPSTSSGQGAQPQPERQIYIQEYRVEGTHKLSELEVEEAVYPYLGPGRTTEDVEHARAALEKAYQEKGYQTVSVQIPAQQVRNGV
ncbi:MAG: hypothetical protein JO170_15310, partial [Verrucomicrobia bacterium]|nr:hypothetical protein [Verrucomicrobiota bacterium]